MAQHTLYYLYKKQRSTDGTHWEDVMPNELSYNGDGTMKPVVVEEDSTECGYGCEQLQRWVDLPISDGYICSGTTMHTRQRLFLSDDCGLSYYPTNTYRIGSPYEENAAECGGAITMYRWTLDGFMCQGYDKYERYKRQVSHDNGGSWTDVEPAEYQRGNLLEANSEDCGYVEPIYRWTEAEGNTKCFGGDLYQMEKYQVSYDNGDSWEDVDPPQYRQGQLVESGSSKCAIYEWRDMDIATNWICDECEVSGNVYYRWFPSGTTCNGRDLHNVEIYQMSTDGGTSWENMNPLETRIGGLVEEDSQQCVSNSYLESIDTSAGGKWVDLGFSLDSQTVVEVDMQVNGNVSSLGTILFGETNRKPKNNYWLVMAYPDRLSVVYGTLTPFTTSIDITPDQRFTLELTLTKMTISDRTKLIGYVNGDRVGNLVLFGDYALNKGENGGVRVYSIRVTKNGELIADLTPLCSDPPTMYNSLTMTPCKVNNGDRESMTCNEQE